MVTENGGLLDERMYCTLLRNCLDKNPVYKRLIAGAVDAGTFQYDPRVLLNICQPLDDDAVKETCDTTPSTASNTNSATQPPALALSMQGLADL